jgi:isopentenyl-diphosphate Delta-isomerase
MVKEVGFGMDTHTLEMLHNLPIQGIDVCGLGGTNWALVESKRQTGALHQRLGALLAKQGYTTAQSLVQTAQYLDKNTMVKPIDIVATGGMRDPIQCAKALSLGAKMVGLSYPFFEIVSQANNYNDTAILDRLSETWEYFTIGLQYATGLVGESCSSKLGKKHIYIP